MILLSITPPHGVLNLGGEYFPHPFFREKVIPMHRPRAGRKVCKIKKPPGLTRWLRKSCAKSQALFLGRAEFPPTPLTHFGRGDGNFYYSEVERICQV